MKKGKKDRLTKAEAAWVSEKVRYLMDHEGKTRRQALGQAYGMVRQKKKGPKNYSGHF
jgi:hypothetical protein